MSKIKKKKRRSATGVPFLLQSLNLSCKLMNNSHLCLLDHLPHTNHLQKEKQCIWIYQKQYRLILGYSVLQLNFDKIIHAHWDFDALSAWTQRCIEQCVRQSCHVPSQDFKHVHQRLPSCTKIMHACYFRIFWVFWPEFRKDWLQHVHSVYMYVFTTNTILPT